MRWLAAACAALLMFLPAVEAGSVDDPEIDDGADTSFPDSNHDMTKIWIEDSLVDTEHGPALEFHVLLAGDYEMTPALFAVYESYRVGFKTSNMADDEEWYIDAKGSRDSISAVVTTVPVGDESAACRFSRAPVGGYANIPEEERLEDLGLAALVDGRKIVCQLPVDRLEGFDPAVHEVYDLWAEQRWVVRGPLSGGDDVGPEVVDTFDRAPDEGFGRVWPSAPSAPEVLRENATFPVEVEHVFDGPTNATYEVVWSNPGGNITLSFDAAAVSGNVTLDLLVGNTSLYACTCVGLGNETLQDTPAGNATLRIAYSAFVGNLTVTVEPVTLDGGSRDDGATTTTTTTQQTPTDDASSSTSAGPAGNETLSGGDDQDAPIPLLAAITAVVLVAWARRR